MRSANPVLTIATNVTTNGSAFKCDQDFRASMTGVGNGTVAGTVKLQYSNDPLQTVPSQVSNWVDLPNSSFTVGATAAGIASPGYVEFAAYWMRIVYTSTSGTGAVSIAAKTSGA